MKKIRKGFMSVKTKLFVSLSIIVISIIIFLIILNNFVLETFYYYNKQNTLKNVYKQINEYYNTGKEESEIDEELEKISIRNNFDILIKNNQNYTVYTSNKDFYLNFGDMTKIITRNGKGDIIIEIGKFYTITKEQDQQTKIKYLVFIANLDNGYRICMRMPVTSIEESVKISNKFLYIIAIFIILIGGVIILFVSRRFTEPIVELNDIAKKMSNLDFSCRYTPSELNDEIDNLGKSINTMSRKLEGTIEQLRRTNIELERDIEEKSKIDDMRKSFISDVSHELKTPIALIQGYSEGLIENVNTDEESRKFYAEVILDEATKMDKLVKQLLELMKLEYGSMKFNNKEFNIIELEKEILRKSTLLMEKENVQLDEFEDGEILVYADDFYIDQVLTNYITNAIRYSTPVNGVKKMKIENVVKKDENKAIVKIFNTCRELSEEELIRIWNRFYKLDESRNRDKGGNGIGLSLVKAIMNNYGNKYGARNVAGGVEFYFEIDLSQG